MIGWSLLEGVLPGIFGVVGLGGLSTAHFFRVKLDPPSFFVMSESVVRREEIGKGIEIW